MTPPRTDPLPEVLVVEDQPAIVDLFRALLSPLRLSLVPAASGARAVELLDVAGCRPVLITLDLILPDMDGLQLLHHIRSRAELQDVPVVAISGRADVAEQRRAFEAGVSDFVAKPFSVELIEAKLRSWLRLSLLAAYAHKLRDFAHEVKNPLAAIHAAAQVACRDDADPPMRRRLCRAIEDEAERIARMLQSHLSGDPAHPQPVTMAPYRLLTEVVEVNLSDSARGRVHIRCNGPLPVVRCDPDRLRQMLVNLLENAVAATEDGGEIDLEAYVDATGVALAVHDTGVGIPDEHLPHVFEDGFTTRGGRRGLGLGITSRLCRAAGGRVEASSHKGRGTTFAIWLPK